LAAKYKGVFNAVADKIVDLRLDRSQLRAEEVDEFVSEKGANNDKPKDNL
jgi:hypothetical protein